MAFNVANSEALYATETAECFDTKGCNGDFEWATSAWGDCQTAGATSINTDQAVCQSSLKRRLDGTEEEHAAIAALPSGVQTRSVTCVLRSGQDGSQREAPQHYCERVHSTKPAEQQTCSKDLICFRWGTAVLSEVRRWSECLVPCWLCQTHTVSSSAVVDALLFGPHLEISFHGFCVRFQNFLKDNNKQIARFFNETTRNK